MQEVQEMWVCSLGQEAYWKWQPTPVFLPGKFLGQRRLAGYSSWPDMTEHTRKKLKTELPYDAATPLLGICLEKNMVQKDTCTLKLTAALLTRAETWKQTSCPSTDEWIKKTWYVYSLDYLPAK